METLKLEHEFNRLAGFTEKDDELPSFFLTEPLPPSDKKARLSECRSQSAYVQMIEEQAAH
jgi:aldehyde:ferredoxin oxidoreductase